MIGTSIWDYVFIRTCIFFLHHITPLSILSCCLLAFLRLQNVRIYWFIEAFFAAETIFYLAVYIPLKRHVQLPANHPELRSREERRQMFHRCTNSIPDQEHYLSRWFLDAPIEEIKRENLKDFFRWAFLNTAKEDVLDDEELEEYVTHTEARLGKSIPPGRGRARCLRLTLDEVDVLHRSLTWYFCVFFVDSITSVSMLYHAFRFHRPSPLHIFSSFPLRPLTLLSEHKAPTETLSYWHRPHTAKNSLPILFIHGIGIGLYPYVNLLAEVNKKNTSEKADGDIGIIAIELMSVSFRITKEALSKAEICDEIQAILAQHGWDKFVLVTHSYGSIIATHLFNDERISPRIDSSLFIDPVAFLLHLPDVAYNFTYRKPIRANEYQLYYFASKDSGVLHTLSRRFFWSESVLWKEDLAGRRATVVLGGQDLIVDTEAVGRHLTNNENSDETEKAKRTNRLESWKDKKWVGDGIEVLWFEDLDHMQVLDTKRDRGMLVNVMRRYCQTL